MLTIITTNRFRKDIKIQEKRGYDMKRFYDVLEKLAFKTALEARYRNHKLKGNLINRWECHIEPDWLLVYRIEKKSLILERTGSHSDIF